MNFGIFGLSGRDKRVYEALLSRPQSSIRAIAEATGVNRGSVFESIKALVEVGLVSYVTTGQRRRYVAQSPELLHELAIAKRRELKQAHVQIDNYIMNLPAPINGATTINFASFYDGYDGLASILRDVLMTCEQEGLAGYCSISSPRVSEVFYTSFPGFTRERIRRQLHVRVIDLGRRRIEAKDANASRRWAEGRVRDDGVYTLVYGSKVALVTVDKYKNVSGVIIANPGTANVQQMLFDELWAGIN